jgi:hypothetical protein
LLAAACALVLLACPKPVEQSQPGPGGLPTGIIEGSSTPPGAETDYPVYPGAVNLSLGKYESRDTITEVKEYYIDLLGIEPTSREEFGDVYTFTTDEFTLILIPIPRTAGGGVEINFSSADGDD